MRPPILIGFVLGIALIAAMVVLPRWRSVTPAAERSAVATAAQARLELHRAQQVLPGAEESIPTDSAALEQAIEASSEQLQKIASGYQQAQRTAREQAEATGREAAPLPNLSADAGAIERVMTAAEAGLRENRTRIDNAIRDARDASQTDGEALGVAQVLGTAQYALAAQLLSEAEALRTELADVLAQLLNAFAESRRVSGLAEYYRDLEVAPIVAELRDELTQQGTIRAQADADVAALATAVEEREKSLADAEARLAGARQELLAVEDRGFNAGDEASFAEYRDAYQSATATVRARQAVVDLLRSGGRRDATWDSDDPIEGQIVDGEAVLGLDELRRRHALASTLAERQQLREESLKERIEFLTKLDDGARKDASRYANQVTELQETERALVDEVQKLAQSAADKESEALRAADAAIRAFGQSQRSVDTWVREAQEAQRERDPDRKNARLTAIVQSEYLGQFGKSAEGAARLLAGRIYVLRTLSNKRLLRDLRQIAATHPDFEIDTAPYESQLESARQEGLDTLQKAQQIFEGLGRGAAKTAWVPQLSQSAVHHLLAQLDDTQAQAQLTDAIALATDALDKRESFPYVHDFLAYRRHLLDAQSFAAEVPEVDTPAPDMSTPEESTADTPAAPTDEGGGGGDDDDEDFFN